MSALTVQDYDALDADPTDAWDYPEWCARAVDPTTHKELTLRPTTEERACEQALDAARRGYILVRVLRRETPESPWVEVSGVQPSRLHPVNARPYSVIRGRH
jgi:hypothetical protein